MDGVATFNFSDPQTVPFSWLWHSFSILATLHSILILSPEQGLSLRDPCSPAGLISDRILTLVSSPPHSWLLQLVVWEGDTQAYQLEAHTAHSSALSPKELEIYMDASLEN